DYDYETIADVLGKTPSSCRQMVKRARGRVTQRRRRFAVSPEEHERVVIKFMEASAGGDYESLVTLLSEDAELVTDHGGKALAARRMICGPDKIARLILGLRKKGEFAQFTTELRFVNGAMSMITRRGDALHGVMTFEIEDGHIRRMFHVVNPDKLHALDHPPSAN
ncbi:MAG: RNA polymerase subunit sigma-24, partial [Candidatus Hydrogenedentota bacterium]